MSFVDKELLEPGCSVLLHQKVPTRLEKELTSRVSLLSGCYQMTLILLYLS